MKAALFQLCAVLGVTVLAGTIYNVSNRGNPQKYLDWFGGRAMCQVEPRPGPAPPAAVPAPGTLPGPGAEPAKEVETPSPSPAPTVFQFIQHAEAVQHYKDGLALFIDARRTAEYEAGHITGAISISVWEADREEKISRLRASPDLNPEAPVVVYCTKAEDCRDSQDLARDLRQAGFVNLLVYEGGFPEWEKLEPQLVTKGSAPGEK